MTDEFTKLKILSYFIVDIKRLKFLCEGLNRSLILQGLKKIIFFEVFNFKIIKCSVKTISNLQASSKNYYPNLLKVVTMNISVLTYSSVTSVK